jgi:hypothetical protein
MLAMPTAGCLVTDPPQFKAPKHTAPFLVESSTDPDTRQVVVIDSATLSMTSAIKTFSADVISQDDPADGNGLFKQVSSRLYIDYGFKGAPGQPFLYVLNGKTVPAGTIDQTTGRRASATWYPDVNRVEPGCHTATLIVSHIFDDEPGCPACADDYSTITWQILRCDSAQNNCDALPVTGMAACTGLTNTCEQVHAQSDAGPICPEDVDGGTQ